MRDIEKEPYSKDEARIAEFFSNAGTGGGDDPVGSILASHAYAVEERNRFRAALEKIAKRYPCAGAESMAGVAKEALGDRRQ